MFIQSVQMACDWCINANGSSLLPASSTVIWVCFLYFLLIGELRKLLDIAFSIVRLLLLLVTIYINLNFSRQRLILI
jgi:hypothetical protein